MVARSDSTSAGNDRGWMTHSGLRGPHESRYGALHGGLDRVTQLRPPGADSTVATAVMRLLSNRKIQLVLNGGFGLVLLGVASSASATSSAAAGRSATPTRCSSPARPSSSSSRTLQGVGLAAALPRERAAYRRRPRLRGRRGVRGRDRPAGPGRRRDPHRDREAVPGHEGRHRDGRSEPARARDARQRSAHADGVGRCRRLDPLDDARGFRSRRRRRDRRRRVVAFLPRIARLPFIARRRFGGWLAEHTHCTKEAWAAWLFISVSWSLRGLAVFLLLDALSMPGSYVLALGFLVASAASAALPIAPAGQRPRRARAPRSSWSAASERHTRSRSRSPRRRSSSLPALR